MTNTFAAAINELKISVMQIKVEGIGTRLLPQYEAAIRVLEAAGKLTREDGEWLEHRVGLAIAEYPPIIDGMTCPACNGTGFVIAEKEGWPSGVAECCQCRIGRKREEGIGRYLDRKKMHRQVEFERRHEPDQGEA